jgi:hypothetical protein
MKYQRKVDLGIMSQVSQQDSRFQISALQVGIAVCTLATAVIHLYIGIQLSNSFCLWFLLNGLGYLALLTVFFLPRFAPRHHKISFLLMGYALFTIVLWFVLGRPNELVSVITSAMTLVIAVLAFYEGTRALRIRRLLSVDSQ